MPQDLRSYLTLLERERPGDLVRVQQPVNPCQEPLALVRRLETEGRFPVLWFEQMGEQGLPVVLNVHATAERLALALGVPTGELKRAYMERLTQRLDPVLVSEGPVQEVVQTGAQVDLGSLPVLTPFEQSPAPYFSGGIVVARDPETGSRNLSFNRMMVLDRKRVSFHPAPGLHLDAILRKYQAQGRPCPVAVILGYHPAFAIGTLAKVPFGVDEYTCAGGMLREPVRLVRCKSVDLEVPAEAEIVLEGLAYPDRKESEGPYGEFTGFALPADLRPVIEFTALAHRKTPIYQDVAPGCTEHLFMGKLPKEATLEQSLKGLHPSVRAVHMPLSGCGRFHMVIAVGPHRPPDVKRIMIAAFAFDHFLKHVFVVDEDVDLASEREVLWALATCFQGQRDLLVLDGMPGTDLDPSGTPGGVGCKTGFDCTRKGSGFPPRHSVDRKISAKMDPRVYVEAACWEMVR